LRLRAEILARVPSTETIVNAIRTQDPKRSYQAKTKPLGQCRTIAGLVARLCIIASKQFAAEDRSRVANAEVIVREKQLITKLNRDRVQTISKIDRLLHELAIRTRYVNFKELSFANSESIGQMADQLVILTLKEYFLRRISNVPGVDRKTSIWCIRRLRTVERQEKLLRFCIDETLASIKKGEPYVFVGDPVKLYDRKDVRKMCLRIHSRWTTPF
jgi:hypothetical protein